MLFYSLRNIVIYVSSLRNIVTCYSTYIYETKSFRENKSFFWFVFIKCVLLLLSRRILSKKKKKKRLEKEHKSMIPDSLGLSLCDPCVKTYDFSSPNCTLLFFGYCIFNVLKKACALWYHGVPCPWEFLVTRSLQSVKSRVNCDQKELFSLIGKRK